MRSRTLDVSSFYEREKIGGIVRTFTLDYRDVLRNELDVVRDTGRGGG